VERVDGSNFGKSGLVTLQGGGGGGLNGGRSKFRHGIGGELPFLVAAYSTIQTIDVAKLSKNSAPQLKKGNLKLAVGSNIYLYTF